LTTLAQPCEAIVEKPEPHLEDGRRNESLVRDPGRRGLLNEARITVERQPEWVGIFRRYAVILDGVRVARLGRAGSCTLNVPPGRHQLMVAIDWIKSGPLDLDVSAGQEIRATCGARGNALTLLFWSTFYHKQALTLQRV
jgi:hypothetical protein